MSMFKKATRKQAKLRLALIGPSGSGKTYSALAIARHLGSKIAVIDTECGSASKYAGDAADFDVLELDHFSPRKYVEAIKAAEQEGYDVIVVDSLSHAWMGKGGALEMVDAAQKRQKTPNSFTAWRDVTPEHNGLVDALVTCKSHVIVTMRAKTEYVLQEGNGGKKVPTKVGMAPIQRDGLEYEFDVVAELDLDHNLLVSKTRCPKLDGAAINRPGKQVADTLHAWLSDGEASVPRTVPANDSASPASAPAEQPIDPLKALVEVDLPQCKTVEQLTVWAGELLRVQSRDKKAAWKAFEAALMTVEPSASPKAVVEAAKAAIAGAAQ